MYLSQRKKTSPPSRRSFIQDGQNHTARNLVAFQHRRGAVERVGQNLELISGEEIRRQEQLRARLKARGFDVTQATLSRDIRDLGLVKRSADGGYQQQGAEPAVPGSASVTSTRRMASACSSRVARSSER